MYVRCFINRQHFYYVHETIISSLISIMQNSKFTLHMLGTLNSERYKFH